MIHTSRNSLLLFVSTSYINGTALLCMAYLHKCPSPRKVKFNGVKTKYKNPMRSSEDNKKLPCQRRKEVSRRVKNQRGIEKGDKRKLSSGFHGVDWVDRFQGFGFGFRKQRENELPSCRAVGVEGSVSLTAVGATDRGVGAFWAPFTGGTFVIGGGVVEGADGTLDWGVLFTEGGVVPEGLAFVALGEFGGLCVWGKAAKAVKEGEGGETKSFEVVVGRNGNHH
jgi:hypothetical protein